VLDFINGRAGLGEFALPQAVPAVTAATAASHTQLLEQLRPSKGCGKDLAGCFARSPSIRALLQNSLAGLFPISRLFI